MGITALLVAVVALSIDACRLPSIERVSYEEQHKSRKVLPHPSFAEFQQLEARVQAGTLRLLRVLTTLLLACSPAGGWVGGTLARRHSLAAPNVGNSWSVGSANDDLLLGSKFLLNGLPPASAYGFSRQTSTNCIAVSMQVQQAANEQLDVLSERPANIWRTQAKAHRDRMLSILHGTVHHDLSHPVWNFVFTYYRFKKKVLRLWSPGIGTTITGVDQKVDKDLLWMSKGWIPSDDGTCGHMDANLCRGPLREMVRHSAEIMRSSLQRPPHLQCFGLHEWAMLYAPSSTSDVSRHQNLPLRLSQSEVNAVVESMPIRCTHFDAFRFFSSDAVPLNTVNPTPSRSAQPQLEQPGCVHHNMDLFLYTLRIWPWVQADVLADSLELAIAARVLDMRASPYDLSEWDGQGFDLTPVRIETAEGRLEYQREQARLAELAVPIRKRLLREYDKVIAVWDADVGQRAAI